MPLDGLPIDKKREAGITFQVKKEGVSTDYLNKSTIGIMYSKAFLDISGFDWRDYADSKGELIPKILEIIKKFPSYSAYMSKGGKVDGFSKEDFLTSRGREIVARLDAIALEIKNIYLGGFEELDVKRILELFEEGSDLIYGQEPL